MEQVLDLPAEALLGVIAVLDGLPDYVRAMLASLLLVALLRFFDSRIAANEVQFGASFRKTALIALAAMPLVIWLVPSSRMVVFVEEMPSSTAATAWGWLALLGAWGLGCALALLRLARAHLELGRALSAAAGVDDQKLLDRLDHWQRRLGSARSVTLCVVPGTCPQQVIGSARLGVPAAALHAPAPVQDVLIIQALCQRKKRLRFWHLLAQLISCCYWPITWVPRLHARLLEDLELVIDGMAESCYGDKSGYARALRQIEERFAEPATERGRSPKGGTAADTAGAPGPGRMAALRSTLERYALDLQRLYFPAAAPRWRAEALPAVHARHDELQWGEPYERVVLFVGQAVFLAFLITGMTLRPMPPEIEKTYMLPFQFAWMENFHRNLERIEAQAAGPPPAE